MWDLSHLHRRQCVQKGARIAREEFLFGDNPDSYLMACSNSVIGPVKIGTKPNEKMTTLLVIAYGIFALSFMDTFLVGIHTAF